VESPSWSWETPLRIAETYWQLPRKYFFFLLEQCFMFGRGTFFHAGK
jgi:hypothetical protein